jgi:hypothetical protein
MNHVMAAPGSLIHWWAGEYRQRIEYPRLSAFICG